MAQHYQDLCADSHNVPKAQDGLLGSWDFSAGVDGVYADLSGKGSDVTAFSDWVDGAPSQGDYTMVVLPDPKTLVGSNPDQYTASIDWILENQASRNIEAVLTMGDLTPNNGTDAQWEVITGSVNRLLGAGIPTMPMRGNTDNADKFNAKFAYASFAEQEWFGGSFEEGKLDHAYWYVTVGERDYLVLSLGWAPSFEVLDWAEEVVRTHPAHNVIVTAHAYMNGDNTLLEAGDMAQVTSGCANGKDIWERLGAYENVVLAMGGHIGNPDIARWYGTNGADKVVASLLADAQYMESQFGMGMVMLLTFHEDSNTVDVNWYSTQRDQMFRERNQFIIEVPHVIHSHSYTGVTTDPTCTDKGYTTYTCLCGDSYVDDYTDVVDHTYTAVVTDPTCTAKGYTTYTCQCGDSYVDDYTDVVDHTYTAVVTDPTCTDKGYTTYTCQCGESYVGDYTDALDHTWSEWEQTKAPTTLELGEESRICSACEEEEHRDVARLRFEDVPEGSYYEAAVDWAVEQKITAGATDTTFEPEAPCTRAQVVTFLWRAAGEPEAEGENPFADVAETEYYYEAVLWAVSEGITQGTSATTFEPEAPCTRAQIVTFLHRFAGEPEAQIEDPFIDLAEGEYYIPAVLWAVENGITRGDGAENTFNPEGVCQRCQIVTFLYRFLAE